jgi:hypothetical protein
MADPGRVKLAVPTSVRRGTVERLRALVLHPQERVDRQGGRSVERNYPPRGESRVVVTYLDRDIVELEPSTAISENPSFTIPFRPPETGLLKVTFFDTTADDWKARPRCEGHVDRAARGRAPRSACR